MEGSWARGGGGSFRTYLFARKTTSCGRSRTIRSVGAGGAGAYQHLVDRCRGMRVTPEDPYPGGGGRRAGVVIPALPALRTTRSSRQARQQGGRALPLVRDLAVVAPTKGGAVPGPGPEQSGTSGDGRGRGALAMLAESNPDWHIAESAIPLIREEPNAVRRYPRGRAVGGDGADGPPGTCAQALASSRSRTLTGRVARRRPLRGGYLGLTGGAARAYADRPAPSDQDSSPPR